MFANGTEYMIFLENHCEICEKYVYWEEATQESPVCKIEEAIGLCSITGEKEDFPQEVTREFVEVNGISCCKWNCSGFIKKGAAE